MADQTINIPRDSTMNTLAKDTTLASILAQLTAQQAKLQAITQALIDRDIIGNNSITGIGDGTLTGAVVSLNNGKQKTLVAGDNIAINQSTGRIDVTGMDVSYNDLDDVPEDIAFYGDETAGAVEDIDPPLYASNVVNDLVTGGVAVPLSAEQGKVLNQNLAECVKNKTSADITVATATGRTLAQALNLLVNSSNFDISKVSPFSYIKIGIGFYRVSSLSANRVVFTYEAVGASTPTILSLYVQVGNNFAYSYNGTTVTAVGGETLSGALEFYY